jgi:hypothetical protein
MLLTKTLQPMAAILRLALFQQLVAVGLVFIVICQMLLAQTEGRAAAQEIHLFQQAAATKAVILLPRDMAAVYQHILITLLAAAVALGLRVQMALVAAAAQAA